MRVVSEVGVVIGFHVCKGLQPSRPGATIAALISIWRASGPSAPRWTMRAFFGRNEGCVGGWSRYRVPRLQGTAALQARGDHRSFDLDLESARSLGATLDDASFLRSE